MQRARSNATTGRGARPVQRGGPAVRGGQRGGPAVRGGQRAGPAVRGGLARRKSAPSASAGSAAQLQCLDNSNCVADFLQSASLRSDDNGDDTLVMDSEVIPPTMKSYKMSWTEGNIDTISVDSTVSDGKVYLQCSHKYSRIAMSCNFFHTFTYINNLECWGGGEGVFVVCLILYTLK